MLTQSAQRWRDGRTVFVTGPAFDASAYSVRAIAEAEAKAFVTAHHYSKTTPATRLSVGLFRDRGGLGPELVGACMFSVPMNNAVVTRYTRLEADAGAELGRLVLLDDVPMPGESWFVSRAFRVLREHKPRLEAVVTYADPAPWRDSNGTITKPGHLGRVYWSLSAAFRGASGARIQWRAPGGQLVSERALSKIRGAESGQSYAVAQLVALGASPPAAGVAPAAWLDGLKASGFLTRRAAPPKLVYSWGLTRRARTAAAAVPRFPYPVLGDPNAEDVTALPLFA